MVKKTTHVNAADRDLATFGGRLAFEREHILSLKQVDLCIRLGVSKTTQIKYEANERFPDIRYLMGLESIGFDLLYLLTGERSADKPMPSEYQNLLDAYVAAPKPLRGAAFAVLLSHYNAELLKMPMQVAGYFQHEILGENDARFERHCESAENPPKPYLPSNPDEAGT
jgi:transcriptional regulator with XRE-family HTH domain